MSVFEDDALAKGNSMKKWPMLYDLSSTGKVKTWLVIVDTIYDEVGIHIKHGYKDGKISNSTKVIDKGKNIGKSNETTPYQQACLQAQSMYEKKLKKGYVDDQSKIGSSFKYLPMLAKTYYQDNHPDVLSGKKKKTILNPNVKNDGIIRIRREVKGRKGKTVTTISGFLIDADELQNLAAQLKRRCGAGGSVKDGIIMIQGDHRDTLLSELKKQSYTVKLSGG